MDRMKNKAVREAREEVTQCEYLLQSAHQNRRQKQLELNRLQAHLKDIHLELDRTQRGEDRYLHLLTEQHKTIKLETALLSEFAEFENQERDAFEMLKNRLRISHERERENEQTTKYWSLTFGIVGAMLGIVGTSINNYMKMRELNRLFPSAQEVHPVLEEIASLVHTQQTQVSKFLEDVVTALRFDPQKLGTVSIQNPEGQIQTKVEVLTQQNTALFKQMEELKRLIKLDQSLNGANPSSVVYVGDQMESLLHQTERNLESKMKLQTLFTVVAGYSVAVLGITLVYVIFK
uniref:Coiled-coil domain-containing protein 51 n=1 Tax=Ditylenchus dipsaci TaxID=166011 RepID=A0A915CVY6_9BILA